MDRPKIALVASGLLAVLMLATMAGAWAAEPLGPGTYELRIGNKTASLEIDAFGVPSVVADDGVVVALERDALGRVTDELLVQTPEGVYGVELDVQRDGVYAQIDNGERPRRSGRTATADMAHARAHSQAIVTVVTACAPQGAEAESLGWPSAGTVLSAATSGLVLEIDARHEQTGERTEHRFDLSTLTGAYELCAAVLPEAQQGSGDATVRPDAGR